MSTKSTICVGKGYHIYSELHEENLVYLDLKNPVGVNFDFWEASQSKVTIALSKKSVRQIAENYLKNQKIIETNDEEEE